MPTERLPMRKVREVLRLKHACGASERLIAQSLGIGRTTVGEYLRRAAVVGITWPVELDDAELERLLFRPAGFYEGLTRARHPRRAAPARRDADAVVGGVPG
jgi:DNA-binding transcriptional regulator LsrR (DeoR family)